MDVEARDEHVDGASDGASGATDAEPGKKKKKKKKSAKSMHDGSASGAPSKHALESDEADPYSSAAPPKKRM